MRSPAEQIAAIAAAYPTRQPRGSLDAVAGLRRALGLEPPLRAIDVVGTNGKTSTATYAQRLLTAAGVRTGLYVSPHLDAWTERIGVDGVPCDAEELLATLAALHARAGAIEDCGELRFFDLLTLAAELIFRRAGVELAVFEAGIGGRRDAVRLLRPELVLLTGVGRDHTELLGEGLDQILAEKLGVAPAGATVLSLPLPGLEQEAERIAAAAGFDLAWVEPPPDGALPAFLERALALAGAGARAVLGAEPPFAAIDHAVPGRLERGCLEGTAYALDAAHNEDAWLELGAELARRPLAGPAPIPLVALVSVSAGKRRDGLAAALSALPELAEVIVTRHAALPAADPDVVAAELRDAGLAGEAVAEVGAAVELAFARARREAGAVLVFGSTHLAGEVRRELAARAAVAQE